MDSDGAAKGNVITVNGNLTLQDNSSSKTGKITGGNNVNGTGGGVYVASDGATFTMQGGTISKNRSDGPGGGVYVASGTFNMTGGSITDNNATGTGEGVCVSENGTFNVSGAPVISGNFTEGLSSALDDVALAYSGSGAKSYITVSGELTSGASIYVNGDAAERNDAIVGAANYTIKESDAGYFHCSGDDSLTAVLNNNGNVVFCTAWGVLQIKLNAGGTVTLDRDYTAGSSDSALVVPTGKNVTLDLNDHYILYKGNTASPVITVNGSLTLKDSKTTGRTTRYVTLTEGRATNVSDSGTLSDTYIEVTGGFIAGGNNESNRGGGVYVENSCMFTMEGGTIVGCKAAYGGGVNANNSGMFTMEDGTIVGCKALYDGGGVFINNSGNFNMNGGSIKNCTATSSGDKRGGGVFISSSGKFNMEGGSITDCTANSGGGVYVFGGTFKVSGTPVIRDNKKGSDANNVALNNSEYITVTGALTTGAEIRVNASNGSKVAVPGNPSGSTTAYTITAADVEKFHSDDTSLSPGLDSGNVVLKATLPKATLSNPSMVYNGSAFSSTISFEGATLTKDSDYTLSYKKVVNTDETALSGAPKDAGSYKLVVAGKGSYAGKQELDFTITKKSVTVVSGITVKDKEYNGGTTAELITTGAVFDGKCDGDTLTVSATGAGTFADKDAGASKAVNIDATKFVLGGASVGNYELANSGHQSTATGSISKKSITITGVTASDKEYDGNTTATTDMSHATVTGLVGSDTVTFTVDGAFADANKGNNKTVTLSNWNLISGGTNYEIDAANSQTITTASITGVQVYVDGVSAQNKVYDGNKTATVTGTATLKRVNDNAAVDGLTVSDITAEFGDKNAGDNKTVTITGGTLSDADNYVLVPGATSGLTANITPKSITITGLSAKDKTYDTTTGATVEGKPVINGKIGNDVVTVSAGTAAFNDENVGNNKTVTFSGFGLSGADSGNYTLSAQPDNVTASITKATPEITQVPTAGAITYGQQLNDSSLSDGTVMFKGSAVSGTFTWSDGTKKPSVQDSNKTSYSVKFIPTDGNNLNEETCSVKLTVNKADIPADKITAPTANALTYNGSVQKLINIGAVEVGWGTMVYAIGTNDAATEPYTTSVPTGINAGTYYVWYKVIGDANHNDRTPAHIEVSIGKAAHSPQTANGSAKYGASGTVDLSALIEEDGTVGTITKTDNDSVLNGEPTVTEGKLNFAFADTENNAGKTAAVTIPITSANYADYRITVTLTVKEKEVPVLTVDPITKTYDGAAVTGAQIRGTAKVNGTEIKGTWKFEYDASFVDAADSGAKKVIFTPEDTDTYDKAEVMLALKINKAVITIKAADKSIYVGDTVPSLYSPVLGKDYTVTGLVGSDRLETAPTLSYSAAPDNTKAGSYTITPVGAAVPASGNYADAISYQTGTLTIKAKSGGGNTDGGNTGGGGSSGGGGSTDGGNSGGGSPAPVTPSENYTVPVSGENTVEVTAEITNGNAVINEISKSDIDRIIDSGSGSKSGEESIPITIDVSQAKSEVYSVELSGKTMERLTEAVNAENNVESVEIKLTNATVTLDGAALSAVNEQAEGRSVTLAVEDTNANDLNKAQQGSLKQFDSAKPFRAAFESGGKEIHDFKGGSVRVSLSFSPEKGRNARHYHIYYLSEAGVMERLLTYYTNGLLSFVTSHFSDYAIVYDQSIENGDPVEPENPEDPEEPAKTIEMHRLYNPNSGEHFYTGNVEEKDHLVELGWNYEGVAWNAPEKSEIPVYRLYNPNAGDHHYTTDVKERDFLIKVGWNDEGIGWYSEESETVALFRLYNPNALGAGAHHFTADAAERDHLIEIGWRDEKTGWYGALRMAAGAA